MGWLALYCAGKPHIGLADNATVRLDADTEVQPDALLRTSSEHGGNSRVIENDFIEGPPELIFEIAATSASYDLHDKKKAYESAGVQEYVVWRIYDQCVDWFLLDDKRFVSLEPDKNGIIRSRVFPGLDLNVPALLKGDMAEVMKF
jgi:Uma2 family endonuclease